MVTVPMHDIKIHSTYSTVRQRKVIDQYRFGFKLNIHCGALCVK